MKKESYFVASSKVNTDRVKEILGGNFDNIEFQDLFSFAESYCGGVEIKSMIVKIKTTKETGWVGYLATSMLAVSDFPVKIKKID